MINTEYYKIGETNGNNLGHIRMALISFLLYNALMSGQYLSINTCKLKGLIAYVLFRRHFRKI